MSAHRKTPLKEKEMKNQKRPKNNPLEINTMKPTSILNRKLQKPWLLISCYDVSFDNYMSIPAVTEKLNETVTHLQAQLQGISQRLKTLDEMIHDYIKTHQQ